MGRLPQRRNLLLVLVSAIRVPAVGLGSITIAARVAFALAVTTHYLPEGWKNGVGSFFVRLPALGRAMIVALLLTAFHITGTVIEPFYYFQF